MNKPQKPQANFAALGRTVKKFFGSLHYCFIGAAKLFTPFRKFLFMKIKASDENGNVFSDPAFKKIPEGFDSFLVVPDPFRFGVREGIYDFKDLFFSKKFSCVIFKNRAVHRNGKA